MIELDKLDKYKFDLMEAIVGQVLTTVAEERKSKGELFAEELSLSILASFVLNVIYRTLTKPSSGAKETYAEYRDMKASLENGIASAFKQAFQEFDPSRTPQTFYCEIEPIPPSESAH